MKTSGTCNSPVISSFKEDHTKFGNLDIASFFPEDSFINSQIFNLQFKKLIFYCYPGQFKALEWKQVVNLPVISSFKDGGLH